jgi:tetratricopeptide (TPR) repeat protein
VAKALARPPGRRSSIPQRERELKRLCLAVCDDTGFRLYAATYDQPKRRDELIERLGGKAKAEKLRVTRLDIAEAGPETSLVGLLRAHLQGEDAPAGWRRAVMVIGIERRLDYSSGREGVAFLHQANLLRDALPEVAPVPVVLWLSPLASSAMQKEAPDLWDWRAASFDFTGDQAPRAGLLRELITLQPGEDLGLSGDRRRERAQMLEELLAELERGGPPKSKRQAAERADLLVQLGIEDFRLGRAAEAIPRFERAVEGFRLIDDREGEGDTIGNLGDAYFILREPRRAIEHYEQAFAIAREIRERRGEARALGGLANTYSVLMGEPRRATEHYEQVLEILREIGDRQGEAGTLGNLGVAYLRLGETQRAISFYGRALEIFRDLGHRRGEANALGALALAYADLDEPQRAIKYFERSLAILREIGDRRGEGTALGNLGIEYADLGEPKRAIEHYEQSLAIAREIGDPRHEGNTLFHSAVACDQLGQRSEAITRMEQALHIFEQIDDPGREVARKKLEEWRGEDVDGESLRSSDAAIDRKQGRAAQ